MKTLSLADVKNVSGGDFDLVLTLHVPAALAQPMTMIVQQIVTGQIMTTSDFVNAINGAGPMINDVRVETIEYQNFN
ncbi:MAG: hypothetical protein BGO43_07550 [Gammaproteobacteria bacterium 39-13]|nr:hypothetical protein [Gammaproteobacteria bacterium]OJV91427.1 MAG: hypothetical protein BGO43_07550 [Gammaproteobacteria bacterium 39-13]